MYHYWNTVTTVRHETAVQSDISTQSQFTSFTYRKERFNPFINESADKQEQISAKQVLIYYYYTTLYINETATL